MPASCNLTGWFCNRNQDSKFRTAPFIRSNVDLSTVIGDNALAYTQSDAGTVRKKKKKGIEYLFSILNQDTRTGVQNPYNNMMLVNTGCHFYSFFAGNTP